MTGFDNPTAAYGSLFVSFLVFWGLFLFPGAHPVNWTGSVFPLLIEKDELIGT